MHDQIWSGLPKLVDGMVYGKVSAVVCSTYPRIMFLEKSKPLKLL
ncbi:hypothetical protein CsSME_00026998 [Camellia sinensis var. sinensis]